MLLFHLWLATAYCKRAEEEDDDNKEAKKEKKIYGQLSLLCQMEWSYYVEQHKTCIVHTSLLVSNPKDPDTTRKA